jgi:GMP synthase-like glutamine amidotransferase
MAMRFDETTFGTQFHPEADAEGMLVHLLEEERKQIVIGQHGEEKYHSMIEHLNDPDKIVLTQSVIIPNFLSIALKEKIKIHS